MGKSAERKSKKARRKPNRRNIFLGLGSYVPEQLPEDGDLMEQRMLAMPAEQMPTLGLAEVYLGSSPIRETNQATLACWVIRTCLMGFGIHSEAVSATIEVANDRGGITRYGDCEPAFSQDEGLTIGHVVLIADGKLVDPTAGQFPEIARAGGIRAVGADLHGSTEEVMRQGKEFGLRLDCDGPPTVVMYRLGNEGSADAAMIGFIEQPHAAENVAAMAENLSLIFAKIISMMPGKVDILDRNPLYRRIVAKARSVANRELVADENGHLYVVP